MKGLRDMKKLILTMLALLLVLSMAACTSEPEATGGTAQNTTPQGTGPAATQGTEAAPVGETTAPVAEDVFSYTVGGVELVPGEAFDASVLGEASFTYTIPSCAFEGTDNVYNYETYEIIAYNEGQGEVIYSVYFVDANITTDEGLALGDDVSRITELYGEGATVNGTEWTYQKGNTLLVIIIQDDFVSSIEYRLAV